MTWQIIMVALVWLSVSNSANSQDIISPHPNIQPQDVIKIQLKSLQQNNYGKYLLELLGK